MPVPGVYVYFIVTSVVLVFWQLLGVALASAALNAPLGILVAWFSSPSSPATWAARSALVTVVLTVAGNILLWTRRVVRESELCCRVKRFAVVGRLKPSIPLQRARGSLLRLELCLRFCHLQPTYCTLRLKSSRSRRRFSDSFSLRTCHISFYLRRVVVPLEVPSCSAGGSRASCALLRSR